MRLDKFLAEHNIGTRSEVKKLIQSGHVTVDCQIIKEAKHQITDADEVCVDGRILSHQRLFYYMFHKPAGCVSACEDALFPTVMDYFKQCERYKELFPIGRLDKDTEGLLIITNDGDYAHRMLSPHKHVVKKYYFESDLALCEEAVLRMKNGLTLKDGMVCKPAVLALQDDHSGVLAITEGAYHQVKRMVAACGGHVTYLKRISLGELLLDDTLKKGAFRELTEEERCQAICQSVEKT